jgi:hypothetical protein
MLPPSRRQPEQRIKYLQALNSLLAEPLSI